MKSLESNKAVMVSGGMAMATGVRSNLIKADPVLVGKPPKEPKIPKVPFPLF